MHLSGLHLVLALAVLLMGESKRWIAVGGSNSEYQDYLDQESINRSGNKVTLWTRRDFATPRTAWHEIEVDCAWKRDTILAYIDDNAGTVSHNIVRPHRPSAAILPGSVEENIYEIVCR